MIKTKIGKCRECPETSPEKPLIDKYHCQHHYWIFRAEVAEEKKKKRAEMNAFLGESKIEKKKQKPIPKVSEKRKVENREYTIKRLQFLAQPENQRCPITGEKATTIHHRKGRIGDLLNDTRYWVALSMKGHEKVENEPIWAKENGYSLNRLEI